MKKTIVLIIFLAIILWWYWPAERHGKMKTNANIVSNLVEESVKKAQLQQNKKSFKQALLSYKVDAEKEHDAQPIGSQDWSYLAIYRRMEWADVCGRYFWFAFRNKDKPSADFVAEFTKSNQHENPMTETDPRVTSGLNRYQARCEALKEAVFLYAQLDENKDFKSNTVALELQHLLDTTPAKTKKEKRLKTHIKLSKEFYQARQRLEETKKQNNKISEEQRSKIYDEMRSLSIEIEGLSDVLDSHEALANYEFLVAEIKKLDDQLVYQYDTKTEDYQAAWSGLLQQWIAVQSRLIGDDPDVFKMIKLASEWSNHISSLGMSVSTFRSDMGFPLKSPGEQMMADFGIEAASIFSLTADAAATLYLCELGYDCGETSPLAMQLCLMHYEDIPEACEVSVQDFYLNHAVSSNLLEDVLTLYQWMEGKYGV